MADSVVEIANLGLVSIGSPIISDMGEATRGAIVANRVWNMVRKAVFRAYPWKCLRARAELPQTSPDPTSDWVYGHSLPPKCVWVRMAAEVDFQEWTVEGRRLLANYTPVKIIYTEDTDDVTKYDPLLSMALGARLAHTIVYAITESVSLRDSAWDLYKKTMSEARSVDSQEGPSQEFDTDRWLLARGF